MAKFFVYQVCGFEAPADTEAWGAGWKEAKAKAIELHAPIHRLVIKDDKVKQESFCSGGLFVRSNLTKPEDWKIW